MINPDLCADHAPFRYYTIKGYEGAIRRYLLKLIEAGCSAEDFQSTSSLLEVDSIKRGMDRVRAGSRRRRQEAIPSCDGLLERGLKRFKMRWIPLPTDCAGLTRVEPAAFLRNPFQNRGDSHLWRKPTIDGRFKTGYQNLLQFLGRFSVGRPRKVRE